MLKLFNVLRPFFEDVYSEISVREYAKLVKISPPTASKELKELEKEDLLISNKKGIYIYFRANKENYAFKNLAKIYWYNTFYALTEELHDKINYGRMILFGSLAKAENTKNSDADIFLDTEKKDIAVSDMQKKLKRTIQLHFRDELKNENLKANIEQGVIIR